MIKLLLEPVNFLILDEPTNHLDMKTKDVLKEALLEFDGTVIVVSHDRYFLDGLVDKVYEFGGGKVRENLGGIYEFLNRKKILSLSELELTKSPTAAINKENIDAIKSTAVDNVNFDSKPKLTYAEQKERAKLISKAEKEVKKSEENISTLENLQSDLENKIASGDSSTDTLEAYGKVCKDLENAMSVWELAQIELDELKEKFSND